jgi:hypothetical protein
MNHGNRIYLSRPLNLEVAIATVVASSKYPLPVICGSDYSKMVMAANAIVRLALCMPELNPKHQTVKSVSH